MILEKRNWNVGENWMTYRQYKIWKEQTVIEEPFLSVIIPAYNEEDRIIPTIGAIASHISSFGFPWELLVADDGSTDSTVKMLEALGLVNLKVLRTIQNEGKGSAVRRGMLASKGKYVLFTDADNSTPIEEIDYLLNQVYKKGFDIAIGSRAVDGAEEKERSFLRQMLSRGLRWIVKNILRIGVKDTQCGFKLFQREVAIKLYRNQVILGFSFDLEILYLAEKFGYKIAEIPVAWIDAPGSKVNARKEAIRFLSTLAKIKINDLRGLYRH